MKLRWNSSQSQLRFNLADVRGTMAFGDGKSCPSHRIGQLVHLPTKTRLHRADGTGGMLTLRDAFCRGERLADLAKMEPSVTPIGNGVALRWAPTPSHLVAVQAVFVFRAPKALDLQVALLGFHDYPAYELLLEVGFNPRLLPGAYVCGNRTSLEQIRPQYNPVFSGMHPFYPCLLRARSNLTDGRWDHSSLKMRVFRARTMRHPVLFFSDGHVTGQLYGFGMDVSSMGTSYSGDATSDPAARGGLYLCLYGQDLSKGQAWGTQVRFRVDTSGDDRKRHTRSYMDFRRQCLAMCLGCDPRWVRLPEPQWQPPAVQDNKATQCAADCLPTRGIVGSGDTAQIRQMASGQRLSGSG